MSKLSTRGSALLLGAYLSFSGPLNATQIEVPISEGRVVGNVLVKEGQLKERLNQLQPFPVKGLFEVAVSKSVPGPWLGSDQDQALEPEQWNIVVQSLREAPFRVLQPHLGRIAWESDSWAHRAMAMHVIERAVQPEAVHLLINLACMPDDSDVPRNVEEVFLEALERVLANDARNVNALRPVFSTIPPGLMTGVFRVLEVYPPTTVLDLIASSLGRAPDLDPLLLTMTARFASREIQGINGPICDAVQLYLSRVDETLVISAAKASGRLGDYEAVPMLVSLLAGSDENVAAAAHRALREITDLQFPEQPDRWTRWLQEEQDWWNSEADQVLADVRSRKPGVPAKALRILAPKRLYRDDIARSLVSSLPMVKPPTGLMICGVLEKMGYRGVQDELHSLAEGLPAGDVKNAVEGLLSVLRPGDGGERP